MHTQQVIQAAVHGAKFGVCILDESHYCKNKDAKRTIAIQSIACKVSQEKKKMESRETRV